MTHKRITLVILFVSFAAIFSVLQAAPTLNMELRKFLAGKPEDVQVVKDRLKKYPIDSLANWVATFNEQLTIPPRDTFFHIERRINDTLTAPAYLYVPRQYHPARPTPLVVYLHGGVSRPSFYDFSDSLLREDALFKLCADSGWLYMFPLARIDCLWWNQNGMDQIIWLIKETKRQFNVDDNRVNLCGFSDGASGSFHFAMLNPTMFANFFPWSGYLTVGSLDGEFDQYAPNLRARPLYPTTGGQDQLYPTAKMLPLLQLAQSAGAKLEHVGYDTAHHDDSYMVYEYPRFATHVRYSPRNPYPKELYWELSDLKWGRVDWLQVTALDTDAARAEWQTPYNTRMKDETVSVGFMADNEYKGDAVRVASVMADSTSAASTAGLKTGDLIIALDTIKVTDQRTLSRAKRLKHRGDEVTITVMRDSTKLILHGKFPPVTEYDAFPRRAKSAAMKAKIYGNRIDVSTSRVKSFNLFLSPALVDLSKPVSIFVNGKKVHEGVVQRDAKFLLDNFTQQRDRGQLWQAVVTISVP